MCDSLYWLPIGQYPWSQISYVTNFLDQMGSSHLKCRWHHAMSWNPRLCRQGQSYLCSSIHHSCFLTMTSIEPHSTIHHHENRYWGVGTLWKTWCVSEAIRIGLQEECGKVWNFELENPRMLYTELNGLFWEEFRRPECWGKHTQWLLSSWGFRGNEDSTENWE